jgi:hypothetical protein
MCGGGTAYTTATPGGGLAFRDRLRVKERELRNSSARETLRNLHAAF